MALYQKRIKFFDEYRDTINKVGDLARDETRRLTTDFGHVLLFRLRDESPVGEEPIDEEYPYYTERDSLRTRGVGPLLEGWDVRPYITQRSASLEIIHDDPARVDWLRFGTKAHTYGPRSAKFLFFWWGQPKRWHVLKPGFRRMVQVEHPGIQRYEKYTYIKPELRGVGQIGTPGDFVMVAVSKAMDDYEAEFHQAMPRIIMPVRRLFGGPNA